MADLEQVLIYSFVAIGAIIFIIFFFYLIRSRIRPLDPASGTVEYITKERRKLETSGLPTIQSKSLELDYDKMVDKGVIAVDTYPDRFRPFSGKQETYSTFRESNRIRKKMLQYSEYIAESEDGINFQEINDDIYSKILSIHPQNLEILPFRPGLVFNFDFKSKYAILRGVGITVTKNNRFFLAASLAKKYPFTIDIRRKDEELRKFKDDSQLHNFFGDNYLLQSNIPDACMSSLGEEKVNKTITQILPNTKRISISKTWLISFFDREVEFKVFFDLLVLMHQNVRLKEKYGEKIPELKCFNCDDPFDLSESTCTKCGSPKPSCVVCLLDLNTSEKEAVIKVPCCGVYAHEDHLKMWLKTNVKCPNCHENLATLLRGKLD
jgi:hypothetical protein